MNPHENAWLLFDYMSANPLKTGEQLDHYHWVRDKGDLLIWPNRIYDITPNLPEATIDEIIGHIKSGKYPQEIQFRLDAIQKSNIDNFLRRGFKVLREFPALSVFLQEEIYHICFPDDWVISLKQVSSSSELNDWASLLGNGFWKDKPDVSAALADVYASVYLDNESLKLFICYVNNMPAATCMAFNTPVGGGIYLVYVKAEYRRHGLGALMTKKAERWCYEQEQDTIILQATQMGEPVYKRLGYKVDFNYIILTPE